MVITTHCRKPATDSNHKLVGQQNGLFLRLMTGIKCLIAAGAFGYESLDSIANPLAHLEAEVLNNSNLAILAVLPGDAPAWYEA